MGQWSKPEIIVCKNVNGIIEDIHARITLHVNSRPFQKPGPDDCIDKVVILNTKPSTWDLYLPYRLQELLNDAFLGEKVRNIRLSRDRALIDIDYLFS